MWSNTTRPSELTKYSQNYAGLVESEELKEALEGFKQVLSMEEGKGEW